MKRAKYPCWSWEGHRLQGCQRRLFQLVDAVQLLIRLDESLADRNLPFTDPYTGIVVLLVRRVWARRVAELSLQVFAVLLVVVVNTIPKRPLDIRVDIHLDH